MNPYYTITPTQMPTSWQPEAAMNTKIHADSNITSNWKYRQYMQNNARHIMKYNSLESIYSSGNNPYTVVNNQPRPSAPFLYKNLHDTTGSNNNSNLKKSFVNKQQVQARMVAPTIIL
jgi:hypothetical protein